MAYQNPLSGCSSYYHTYPPPDTTANPHPYLPNQTAAMSDQAHLPNYMSTLNALHRRIAVLETELAQAVSDKIAAEHAAQYVLKLIATDRHGSMSSSGHEEELRLEREVRAVNAENTILRVHLRKAILLQKTATRSQEAKYNAIPENGASPFSATVVSGVPSSAPRTNPTLVNLMDLEEIPGLDCSTGSSTSDDDFEQLNNYARTLPRIDLVTKERSKPDVYTDSEQRMSHFVRRFVQDSSEDAATLTFAEHPPIFEQDCTSNDPLVLETSPVCTGPRETTANSYLEKIIADRIYSEDPYPKNSSNSDKTGISKTNVDFEVFAGQSIVTTSETLAHGRQDLPTANETVPNIPEAQLLAPTNGVSKHMNSLEQSFIDATCGPCELFSSRADREYAIKNHQSSAGSQECRFPDLFRYGIRYEPPASQTDTFKMVSIMNLPADISLKELMSKIRGGTVVSCNLLDTTGITGKFSALVRFSHEHEALAYDDFVAAHPIVFRGSKAHVTTIKTPSWPLSMGHTKAIFNHHHTRCLEVVNFPRNIPPAQLARDLRSHAVEHMQMRQDGILELRFSSIDHADRAYGLLTTAYKYRQCGVSFGEDPCALPLDTLMEPVDEGHDGIADELVHQDDGDETKILLACTI
ncbi:hypothetical protein MMC27_001360 [Xylographa pallens]|nr:hypothetical protein [Xylographa pallens]